ncbi:MAG: YHS domain-containing protein [Gemmatimonadota bacterium]
MIRRDAITHHDEVCGMNITPEEIVASIDFQGKSYHFCSERCLQRFEEHPGWYVAIEPVVHKAP